MMRKVERFSREIALGIYEWIGGPPAGRKQSKAMSPPFSNYTPAPHALPLCTSLLPSFLLSNFPCTLIFKLN